MLLLLLLIPFAFAVQQWQITTGIAILTSGLILVALYLAGSMGIRELEFVTHEEFYQLIVTAVMAGSIIGVYAFMTDISLGFLDGQSIQQKANSIIDTTMNDVSKMQTELLFNPTSEISAQGAKSAWCNFMSSGVNLAACGSYRMLGTPLSMAYQLTGPVLAELYAMKMLLDIGSNAFTFFIPFGIFLRAFKFTRGAGGFFIGIGLAFYFMLPLAIVAIDTIFIESYQFDGKSLYTLEQPMGISKCDEWDTGSGNLNKAKTIFSEMQPFLKHNLAVLFIRGVFLPVISLMLMVVSIRVLTALGGAEIDTSMLSKIA